MKMLKCSVLLVCAVFVLLSQVYAEDLIIPSAEKLDRFLMFMRQGYASVIRDEDVQKFGFNKRFIDWTESDFESLQAALQPLITKQFDGDSTFVSIEMKQLSERFKELKKEQSARRRADEADCCEDNGRRTGPGALSTT